MNFRCQWPSARLPVNRPSFFRTQFTQRTFATALDLSKLSEVPEASEAQEVPDLTELEELEDSDIPDPTRRPEGGDLGSHLPKYIIPKGAHIPSYPYGHRHLFRQANKGLYGDQTIQFGNNVSRDTETKTRRYWKPNILSKSLYSVALKKRIKLRVAARVLKTIDREGGLDEYLLKDSEHRVKELGPLGWAMRWTLMQKPDVIDRLRADAAALGLDQAVINKQWPTRQMMAEQKSALIISNPVEQGMWEPEEDELFQNHQSSLKLSKDERREATKAIKEYRNILKAAQRYLSRGLVDSEEEGMKVAFIRTKERKEAAIHHEEKFQQRLQQQFTAKDLQKIKAECKQPNMGDDLARKIAYSQYKQEGIKAAGDYKAWREKIETNRAPPGSAGPRSPDRETAWRAKRKAEYAEQVKAAEIASTNDTLDAEMREHLERAIDRANKAIKAKASGGEHDFAELILSDLRRERKPSRSTSHMATSTANLESKTDATRDAWGAIVSSSNSQKQSRLNS